MSNIPIKNIFYLLSYAWDCWEENKMITVNSSDYKDILNLYAKILINGCDNIFKSGLDRNYTQQSDELTGLRGKLNLDLSVKQNIFIRGRIYCDFDDFQHNILHNQILKTILYRILNSNNLDNTLRDDIKRLLQKFSQVDMIQISKQTFNRIQLYRHNRLYYIPLLICRLFWENMITPEGEGKYIFKDFTDDPVKMGRLFESFVRNFYKETLNQSEYKVRRENIDFNLVPIEASPLEILPIMKTDISITTKSKKIIIETKCYQNIFSTNYEKKELRSGHIYQLFAYLQNLEKKGGLNVNCEGILLYPMTDITISASYQMMGNHRMTIKTLDLSQDWKDIESDLLQLLE